METKNNEWSFCIDRYDIQKVFVDSGKMYISIEPLRHNDRDYFQYKNAYLLALDENSGKVLWKIKKGIWLEGIYNYNLLIGDENNLYAIDPD
jgi:outer membrane protein assembly factor BamB